MTISSAFVYGQEVISSQGATIFSDDGYRIDYTIGEPVVKTVSEDDVMLTQGYHQPTLSIIEVKEIDPDFDVQVFPNPTTSLLKVRMEDYEGISYQIQDADGRVLKQDSVDDRLFSVDVKKFTTGYYIMKLVDADNKKLKSYKFLKH